MLYTAILVACLSVTPEPVGCRTHEILVTGSAVPYGPALEAQVKAAEWLAQHHELTKLSLTLHAGRAA